MSGTHRPNIVVEVERRRPRPGWFVNFADFANMVKAFIGSNYLSVAYAFSQSGLALGIGGMLLIAGLTDHCCHLLIKTKYKIIKNILEKQKKEKQSKRQEQHTNNGPYTDTPRDPSSEDDGDDDYTETFMRRSIEQEGNGQEEDDKDSLEEQEDYMKKHITFGDIGRTCFGKFGIGLVNFCIAMTQFGFCVGYFIFLGNTIHSLFPVKECYVDRITHYKSCHIQQNEAALEQSLYLNNSFDRFPRSLDIPGYSSSQDSLASLVSNYTSSNVTGSPDHNATTVVPESNITTAIPSNITTSIPQSNVTTALPPSNITTAVPSNITTAVPSNITTAVPSNTTTAIPSNTTTVPSNVTTVSPASNVTWSNITLEIELVSHAPNLIWLVASPLPIFILFALIRSVRYLGVVSVLANISILFGCVSIFGFLIVGFHVSKTVTLVNLKGFTVFFGMVTGSFEGIGLVIPVESSMEGNRHLFPLFLHLALLVLTLILGFFGICGYLRNGIGVHQMLNKNIPRQHPLGMAVNLGICLGILLTFPLQIFPVIEIIERQLFTPGRLCGPSKTKTSLLDEQEKLIGDDEEEDTDIAARIPDSVPTWKRNIVRILIVLVACGLAILLRNYFAYVGAFIGSVGSSVLGFILPCMFHLRICWKDLNVFVKIKDIVIIVFGIVASLVCAISVVQRIISGDAV